MQKILLIDDSPEIFQIVDRFLSSTAHLTWAQDLKDAGTFIHRENFDLILLDVMLPDGDGFQFYSTIQSKGTLATTPVIFLTSKGNITEKVMGFSLGAEDYIVKPFDPLELKARVEAKLRKKNRDQLMSDILKWDGLEINKSMQRVWIKDNGRTEEVSLTSIEMKILLLLSGHPHRVYNRDEILDAVWGRSLYVYPRSVDTHISKLRKKLGPSARFIESVHGSGYRFKAKSADDENENPTPRRDEHTQLAVSSVSSHL